jgi:hypothetical protein
MAPTISITEETFKPTESQISTMYFIAIYAASILILWNIPYLEYILWPFKIFTVALHEFSHAIVGICTGARIKGITVSRKMLFIKNIFLKKNEHSWILMKVVLLKCKEAILILHYLLVI